MFQRCRLVVGASTAGDRVGLCHCPRHARRRQLDVDDRLPTVAAPRVVARSSYRRLTRSAPVPRPSVCDTTACSLAALSRSVSTLSVAQQAYEVLRCVTTSLSGSRRSTDVLFDFCASYRNLLLFYVHQLRGIRDRAAADVSS